MENPGLVLLLLIAALLLFGCSTEPLESNAPIPSLSAPHMHCSKGICMP